MVFIKRAEAALEKASACVLLEDRAIPFPFEQLQNSSVNVAISDIRSMEEEFGDSKPICIIRKVSDRSTGLTLTDLLLGLLKVPLFIRGRDMTIYPPALLSRRLSAMGVET